MKLSRQQLRRLIQEVSGDDNDGYSEEYEAMLASGQPYDKDTESEDDTGDMDYEKIYQLIKSGDPAQVRQARELAESIGTDFKQLVTNMVKTANPLENTAVDNIIYEIDDVLYKVRDIGLGALGVIDTAKKETFGSVYIDQGVMPEDKAGDLDMDMIFSVRGRALNAVEEFMIDFFMELSK